ncbi:Putative cupin superfamily protein OS=Eoetvoesiella caeni OX=645616 GN=DFR37_11917 PE=4 SV=1 [Eoetvoesiella caeni]
MNNPGAAMSNTEFPTAFPTAIVALDAAPRTKASNYPEPFASRMAGREKRPLGELFGLSNFGVNHTRLIPGACSALRHAHSKQDEFVYILAGQPTLITDQGETALSPGMCAGFKAGTGNGHQLVNRTSEDVIYLEVGDRMAGDSGSYPDDDLQAVLGNDGKWQFLHKNGTPY